MFKEVRGEKVVINITKPILSPILKTMVYTNDRS